MLPAVHRTLGGLLVTALLVLVAGQGVHKRFDLVTNIILTILNRFEYKFSFKPPYLAQKDGSVPFFEYSGNAIASEESVRITPSLRSQKGMIWTREPTTFDWCATFSCVFVFDGLGLQVGGGPDLPRDGPRQDRCGRTRLLVHRRQGPALECTAAS
jgi:hypothetical protein